MGKSIPASEARAAPRLSGHHRRARANIAHPWEITHDPQCKKVKDDSLPRRKRANHRDTTGWSNKVRRLLFSQGRNTYTYHKTPSTDTQCTPEKERRTGRPGSNKHCHLEFLSWSIPSAFKHGSWEKFEKLQKKFVALPVLPNYL